MQSWSQVQVVIVVLRRIVLLLVIIPRIVGVVVVVVGKTMGRLVEVVVEEVESVALVMGLVVVVS